VTVASLAAPAAGATASSETGGTSRAVATACTKARIGGHSKCLAAGQLCSRKYEKQYERKGFYCRNNKRKYRLVKIGMSF
jgi:hypothetical protein